MEALWIGLYEREYIEENDVTLVQRWLEALLDVGYHFPQISRSLQTNVVLMGQFNFASPFNSVAFWNQKWKEVFQHVTVCGPWEKEQLDLLNERGVVAQSSRNDRGHYSPMENLAKTLQRWKETPDIDGVLYLHDDAYLNMTEMLHGSHSFPVQSCIGTLTSGPLYFIQKDGGWQMSNGKHVSSIEAVQKSLPKWGWWGRCIPQLQEVFSDRRSKKFTTANGSFAVAGREQSDTLFVPIRVADSFTDAAQLMVEHKVFLECGMPTIAQMLHQRENVSFIQSPLCTSWASIRGTEKMLESCMSSSKSFGVFHPFKISRGIEKWGEYFDLITFAKP